MTSSSAHAWDEHAQWYIKRHGLSGDAHHSEILIPAILRHLRIIPEMRVLDCCCGHGVVSRSLASQGVSVTGVDGCEEFIRHAQAHAGDHEHYMQGDAHELVSLVDKGAFDAALLIMSLQDLDPITDVLYGIVHALKIDGTVILILTHPAFRIPKHSDWAFDKKSQVQQRVLDAYLSQQAISIQMGAGADAHTSPHFHRPLQYYIRNLGQAGLAVIDAEELCTMRRGSQGTRSAAEDQAQREFPMFLLLKAQKI